MMCIMYDFVGHSKDLAFLSLIGSHYLGLHREETESGLSFKRMSLPSGWRIDSRETRVRSRNILGGRVTVV